MITDEQILKIAREHLYILTSVNEWCGEDEDILKFARAIYEEGYDDGCYRATNSTGLVGDPQ
jgi:hypothetical protein